MSESCGVAAAAACGVTAMKEKFLSIIPRAFSVWSVVDSISYS